MLNSCHQRIVPPQTLISSYFFACRSRLDGNLGLVLLLVDASLDFVDYRVECGKCEALRLPDTGFPSIRDSFFDQDGLDVVNTSSKNGQET